MTLKQIVNAHAHIGVLLNTVYPYPVTRGLFRLSRRLKEEFDAVVVAEKALVAEYGGTVTESGRCTFPDAEKQTQFSAKKEELMTQEQDINLPTVDLSQYTGSIRISPMAMEALDGIVIFEREDGTP